MSSVGVKSPAVRQRAYGLSLLVESKAIKILQRIHK